MGDELRLTTTVIQEQFDLNENEIIRYQSRVYMDFKVIIFNSLQCTQGQAGHCKFTATLRVHRLLN